MPQDLVYCTTKGTPLSPKNLYNRVLAPACDNAKLPRVPCHSFRHGNATLLGEVGESIKTAQAILGHSDIETTLNTYMHAIPDSQRLAVDRVAGVLFPDVPKLASGSNEPSLLNSRQLKFCLSAVGIFGFLAFESSREALKDRSEDEARHTD